MDASKSMLLSSALLAIVITITFHLHRQDVATSKQDLACVNLFNGLGDSMYSKSSMVDLYSNGQIHDNAAKAIWFSEKMHGITVANCMKR